MVSKNKVTLELCEDYFKGIYFVVEIVEKDNKYTYNPIKIINNQNKDGCSIVSYLTDKQKPKRTKYITITALKAYNDKLNKIIEEKKNEKI